MISVAMTTYNSGRFLKKQLESILSQTFLPDEVVIVDDYSSDNTVEMIKDFISTNELCNWRLICSNKNEGYKKAFYTAIMNTKGDIIFLCDHDDIWLSSKIEIMNKIMNENPNIIALSSGFEKIDENDCAIVSKQFFFSSNHNLIRKRIKNKKCEKIHLNKAVVYNISPGCTSAFRSSIKMILSQLKEEKYNLIHDWKINIIAAAMDGLYFVNVPTTRYRLHSTNSIGLSKSYTVEARINSYEKALEEKKIICNILEKLVEFNIILNKKEIKNNIKEAKLIEKSFSTRIVALKKKSVIDYILMLCKYHWLKTRMIESWSVDIYIIAKNSINHIK